MRFYHLVFITGLLCSLPVSAAEPSAAKFGQAAAEADAPAKGWPARAQEILMSALSLTGIKYTYGGESPETGFDCSGFVRYVFQQAENLTLPHGARALSQLGQRIPMDQLQPGDLVFFNTLKSAFSHVGIYIGNKRFIHAPSAGGDIHVVSMEDEYWAKRYNGARRIDPDKVGSGGSRMTPPESRMDEPGKQ
ncbi:MAG TPA: C40 family peptidase [Methylophilaceae bacterium]|nr:C40 family peptidase [Methylophilaceae bacterium]